MQGLLELTRALAPIRDRGRLETRAASELHRLLGGTLVCVTPLRDDALVVGATQGTRGAPLRGLRIAPGSGVGGRAAACGQVVAVDDYAQAIDTSTLVELMAGTEGIRGAAAAPLRCDGRTLGIVFAGHREPGAPGDRELRLLSEVGDDLGRLLGAADQAVAGARASSRRGAATAGGRAARRGRAAAVRDRHRGGAAARAGAGRRGGHGGAGGDRGPHRGDRPRADRGAERDDRTGPGAHRAAVELLDLGAEDVAPDLVAVLCRAVAEALTNVSKHAPGATAVVTVFGAVEVTVQDDGPGLGAGEGFGLAALRDRLLPYGGTLDVGANEDGGVTVTVRVPLR